MMQGFVRGLPDGTQAGSDHLDGWHPLTSSLMVAGAVWSAGATDEFGQHVAACALNEGFDGARNPGMHPGFAGWDHIHDC